MSKELSGQKGGVAAVERALDILTSFDQNTPALSLSEIAFRTGFYKSTILRLIASLERKAFIERGNDGLYRIGPAALRTGSLYMRDQMLEERLLPIMRKLSEETGESVSFYVPLTDVTPPMRVCMLRVDTQRSVREHVRVGDRLPLAEGAAGRIIRTFLDLAKVKDKQIRDDRAYVAWGERDPEILGVASPVFGPDGRLAGALTLSAPTARRSHDWGESMKSVVLKAADHASRDLGAYIGVSGFRRLSPKEHKNAAT